MNFQFYREKLENSDNFKKFMKIHPDAYFCSGFFIIDKEGKGNKQHFDFLLPGQNKIISFQLEEKMQQVPVEMIGEKVPEEVSMEHDFELDDIEKMITERMGKEGIKSEIKKIIISLQKVNRKDYLVGTVFVSMLGMLKVHIDLEEQKIVHFEKKSIFDMMKIIRKKKD